MSIQVSIVSGTYNRLSLLKPMIDSVRENVDGFSYEIILVDGGSTDGTIDWCKTQDDIHLIEQGELVGAVRAFNAGCKQAQGKYVVLLNDDIVVRRGTLKAAYDYLEQNGDVGEVAFYNESVRNYPTYVDNAFKYVYGQCCMIRRWLGEFAGWWGTEYHTYAGDTQLSMVLWEHGWKVVPLKECVIVDYRHQDELRRNRTKLLGEIRTGKNVDTVKFYEKWTGRLPTPNNWIGIGSNISHKVSNGTLRTVRLKIVSTDRPARTSMINAFAEFGEAVQLNQSEFSKNFRNPHQLASVLLSKLLEFKADLLITQIQGNNDRVLVDAIKMLKGQVQTTKFVNIDGDARFPLLDYHFNVASVVDLQLVSSATAVDSYISKGYYNVGWLTKAPEEEFLEVVRDNNYSSDIIFLGNYYAGKLFPEAETRKTAIEALLESEISVTVYGDGWRNTDITARAPTIGDRVGNAQKYAKARLALSISAFTDLYGYTSNRLFNICATGCPALVQQFDGMEQLGFVDGETCIAWTSLSELVEKTKYALENEDWREEIGRRGRELMLSRHTYHHRVAELLYMVDSLQELSCFKTQMY